MQVQIKSEVNISKEEAVRVAKEVIASKLYPNRWNANAYETCAIEGSEYVVYPEDRMGKFLTEKRRPATDLELAMKKVLDFLNGQD